LFFQIHFQLPAVLGAKQIWVCLGLFFRRLRSSKYL
jgi:hypothetical protein